MLMEPLMNLTLPSASRKLAPPAWLLVALANEARSELQPPSQLSRQAAHEYCVEFGGTMVLNSPTPGVPHPQRLPRPGLIGFPAWKIWVQAWSPVITPAWLLDASSSAR